MKIALLADAQSIYTVKWCEQLTRMGHEVHVITFRDAKISGAAVHFIDTGAISAKGGNWRPLLSFRKAGKLLKKIRPDILHAHYISSYGVVGALTGFHPFIVSALGTDVLVSPVNSAIHRIALRYVFSKADWITAVAGHMIEPMLALGAPGDRTEAVLFGINPAVFNSENFSPPADRFVITSTRNFEPVYNLSTILAAVEKVKQEIPNLELRMIGSGSLQQELEQEVNDRGLSAFTRFTGQISQQQLAGELSTTHLFISMSRSDGNPISVNEAMACGPCIIASDIPANAQWIKDGENGLLCNVDDADGLASKILYVYRNYSDLSKKAANINREIINERLQLPVNMAKVERKYKELAARNSK